MGTEAAPARILGTAGHIDHGKTALIRALTGVDTDRLPEEKARGITIELGFAALDLPGAGRVGVVDVPGHESLVRTMVAGATGIDVVLLVVAADEGAMPQTREHLAICALLGIDRGVAALTKVDVADPEVAELAEAELRELLDAGPLRDTAIVRVSSVTGEGIDALRDALGVCLAKSDARTPRTGPARLWIDRAFAMHGFGSVVTGTLVGAPLSVGDAVEIAPEGFRARVRGLERHGHSAQTLPPGARCAVNLQGVELAQLARGQSLVAPDRVTPTTSFDARVHWLPEARPLHEPTSLTLLTGTAERVARVTPLGDGVPVGGSGFVRAHLDGAPLPLLPGDRFVLRGFTRGAGGGWTVGGGRVVDVAPARRRARDPQLLADLAVIEDADLESALAVRVRRGGFAPVAEGALAPATGADPDAVHTALVALARADRLVPVPPAHWLDAGIADALCERARAAVDAFHAAEPLQPGMTRGALCGQLPENVGPAGVDALIDRLVARGELEGVAERMRRPGQGSQLSAADRALTEDIAARARASVLAPPTLKEWTESLGLAAARARDLFAYLEREGRLVRAPGDLWFDAEAVAGLRERVRAHLRAEGQLDTPTYKRMIGGTRKHVVPLMELFDREGLTRRRGDLRVLHRGHAAAGDRGSPTQGGEPPR